MLHASESEAALICGDPNVSGPYDDAFCRRVAAWTHKRGVAVCAITLGSGGCFVSTTPDAKRLLGVRPAGDWTAGASVRLPAYKIGQAVLGSNPSAEANANGAGDTFCAGFLAAMLQTERQLSLSDVVKCASLAALHRVDDQLRDATQHCSMEDIVELVTSGTADLLEVMP